MKVRVYKIANKEGINIPCTPSEINGSIQMINCKVNDLIIVIDDIVHAKPHTKPNYVETLMSREFVEFNLNNVFVHL